MKKAEEIKKIVKDKYGEIAVSNSGCGCSCSCGNESNEQIARTLAGTASDWSKYSEYSGK